MDWVFILRLGEVCVSRRDVLSLLKCAELEFFFIWAENGLNRESDDTTHVNAEREVVGGNLVFFFFKGSAKLDELCYLLCANHPPGDPKSLL